MKINDINILLRPGQKLIASVDGKKPNKQIVIYDNPKDSEYNVYITNIETTEKKKLRIKKFIM